MVNNKGKDQDIGIFIAIIVIVVMVVLGFNSGFLGSNSNKYNIDLGSMAFDNNLTYDENEGIIIGGNYTTNGSSGQNINQFKFSINDNLEEENIDVANKSKINVRMKFRPLIDTNGSDIGYLSMYMSAQKTAFNITDTLSYESIFSTRLTGNTKNLDLRYWVLDSSYFAEVTNVTGYDTYWLEYEFNLEENMVTGNIYETSINSNKVAISGLDTQVMPNGYDLQNLTLGFDEYVTGSGLLQFNIEKIEVEVE